MSYIVLARKYRPQKFDDVIGQPHVCRILKNAIAQERIGHAYIFSGQRGTGKTTVARIFAKVLNCKKGPVVEPCNECENCKQIMEGNSIDVLEIDAASNRGIDEIRALRDNIKFTPISSKYKVYIIDEAHQITDAAFNALLKTLEEPPPHVIFILATTEPQKIPLTILSRCQRFMFLPITSENITKQLLTISEKEKFNIDKEAIALIAKIANGSLRDSLSILDQIISISSDEKITYKKVVELLGLSPTELISSIVDTIISKNSGDILEKTQYIANQGYDFIQIARDLREYFRKLIFISLDKEAVISNDCLPEEKRLLSIHKTSFSLQLLLRNLHMMNRCVEEIKWSDKPRLVLELYLLKIIQPVTDIDELITRIENIQNKISSNSDKETPDPEIITKQQVSEIKSEYKLTQANTEKGNDLSSIWKEIVNEITELKPSLTNLSEYSIIKKEAKDLLTIYVSDGFYYEIVQSNTELIENIIKKYLGNEIRLKIESNKEKKIISDNKNDEDIVYQIEEEQPSEKTPEYELVASDKNISIDQEHIVDPKLKKIIKEFSGKIIK